MPNPLTDPQLLRFSRQILLPAWDIGAQQKLLAARVLMVGMGGLGCPASQSLARAGIGFLRVVDDDVVEESNLQRQSLFNAQHIGQAKVFAAKTELEHINPWLTVEAHQLRITALNLPNLLKDIDLVLDGSDNFATRDAVNAACVHAGIPLLSAAAIGLEGQLTFIAAGGKPCYRCLFGQTENENTEIRCSEAGVLASTTQVMGNLQAHNALLYLGLGQTPLAQKLLLWDGVTMQQRLLSYMQDPCCAVCQKQ